MHDVEEHVVVRAEPDQEGAQHGVDPEIERMLGLGVQQALQLGVALVLRQVGEIDDLELDDADVLDDLHRTVVDEVVPRAEDLVAGDETFEGALKNVRVDRALEAECRRCVVGDALSLELAQEPEELLRVRERGRHVGPAPRNARVGRDRGAALEQPALQKLALRGTEAREPRVEVHRIVLLGCAHRRDPRTVSPSSEPRSRWRHEVAHVAGELPVSHALPDAHPERRALAHGAANPELLVRDLEARLVARLREAATARPLHRRALTADGDAARENGQAARGRTPVDVCDERDRVRVGDAVRMEEDLGRELDGDVLHPPALGHDVDVVTPHLVGVGTAQLDVVRERSDRRRRRVERHLGKPLRLDELGAVRGSSARRDRLPARGTQKTKRRFERREEAPAHGRALRRVESPVEAEGAVAVRDSAENGTPRRARGRPLSSTRAPLP